MEKRATFTATIEKREYSPLWPDGSDVTKAIGIYDAYNYQTVERLTKYLNKELSELTNRIIIDSFDVASGNQIVKVTIYPECDNQWTITVATPDKVHYTVKGKTKAIKCAIDNALQYTRINFLDNPAYTAA